MDLPRQTRWKPDQNEVQWHPNLVPTQLNPAYSSRIRQTSLPAQFDQNVNKSMNRSKVIFSVSWMDYDIGFFWVKQAECFPIGLRDNFFNLMDTTILIQTQDDWNSQIRHSERHISRFSAHEGFLGWFLVLGETRVVVWIIEVWIWWQFRKIELRTELDFQQPKSEIRILQKSNRTTILHPTD